jgi:hypothetical protein
MCTGFTDPEDPVGFNDTRHGRKGVLEMIASEDHGFGKPARKVLI